MALYPTAQYVSRLTSRRRFEDSRPKCNALDVLYRRPHHFICRPSACIRGVKLFFLFRKIPQCDFRSPGMRNGRRTRRPAFGHDASSTAAFYAALWFRTDLICRKGVLTNRQLQAPTQRHESLAASGCVRSSTRDLSLVVPRRAPTTACPCRPPSSVVASSAPSTCDADGALTLPMRRRAATRQARVRQRKDRSGGSGDG